MTETIQFFDSLAEAVRAARNTDLYVIDGPDDNYAVVDRETAVDIQDVDPPYNSYGFWSIEEAEAVDKQLSDRDR